MDKEQITTAGPSPGRNRFVGRVKRGVRAAIAAALVTVAWTAAPRAQLTVDPPSNPCDNSQAPSCQQQVISGALKPDGSEYMADYCPAAAPYWWGNYATSATHATSFTPNPIGDNTDSEADFLLTNWNPVDTSHWAIAIDCSPVSQTGTCTGATKIIPDPNCPISNEQNVCDGSDNCYLEWNEICTNVNPVVNIFCSQVLFATTCWSCND